MTSWRDMASPRAQADLDELLNASLGFAQHQLANRGEYYPYAATLGQDGTAGTLMAQSNEGDEHPDSVAVIASCVAALIDVRHTIRAGAVVSDVRLSDGGDAVRVDLEHSEGATLTVLLPYAKKRFRGVAFGQLRAQSGERRIWADR
jgi:hypothetical protein